MLLFFSTNIVPLLIGLLAGLALGIVGTVLMHKEEPLKPFEIAEYAKKNRFRVSFRCKVGEAVHHALVREMYLNVIVFAWQEAENGQLVWREKTVTKEELDWVRL